MAIKTDAQSSLKISINILKLMALTLHFLFISPLLFRRSQTTFESHKNGIARFPYQPFSIVLINLLFVSHNCERM